MSKERRTDTQSIYDHLFTILIIAATGYAAWWLAGLGVDLDPAKHLTGGPIVALGVCLIGKVLYHASSMAQDMDLASAMIVLFTLTGVLTTVLAVVEKEQPLKGILTTMSGTLLGIGLGGLVGRRASERVVTKREAETSQSARQSDDA